MFKERNREMLGRIFTVVEATKLTSFNGFRWELVLMSSTGNLVQGIWVTSNSGEVNPDEEITFFIGSKEGELHFDKL